MAVVSTTKIRYRCTHCNRVVSVMLPRSLEDRSGYCDNYEEDYIEVSESPITAR